MSPDPSPDNGNMRPADPPPEQPPIWAASYAPKLAVVAVAGAAVAAAFMSARPETTAPVAASPASATSATSAMGASPGCQRCGVVESVRTAEPGQSFQVRIRMDDGSVRTLEQRVALATGTRVVVNGGAVRLMPG